MSRARDVNIWGERRGAYRVLVGKREGKKHLKDPGLVSVIVLTFRHRASSI